jgi:transposase InsO family protein
MVTGLSPISFADGVCIGCVLGKHPQDPFDKRKSWRALKSLQIVHNDVAGPFPNFSFQGARYLLTFIDEYSRCIWVYFLKNKSEVFDNFLMFKALVEKQSGNFIKC